MLCDNCRERDAVVKLTRVVEGEPVYFNLCEKCASEQGVEPSGQTAPKTALGDMLFQVQQQLLLGGTEVARCSFCQLTLKEFRQTGRLGCARCYSSFESSLRELLRRVHGGARHAGRKYEPPRVSLPERLTLLGELKERLRRAVETEQFELAADLRDRIRVLE
jgi:protein arginine kinase activator